MKDSKKTKAELLSELETLRARIRDLEKQGTDLKSSIHTAEEAQAYAESIVDTVRQPLLVLDADLRVVSANRFFYGSFGVSKEETKGRLIYDLGNGQWRIPKLRELFEEVLPKHTHFHDYAVDHEFPHIGHRTMLLNARQIYSRDIGKNLILLAIEDITERKRVEEALRASLDRHRSYIDVTGQLGWTTNGNGEVEEDVPSFRKFTGQTYEEVKGWGWINALHPDDVKRTEDVWRKATASKGPYEVEYRVRRHDGIYRCFLARGIPVFKEKGEIREWVGACIDITEHKWVDDALRVSNRLLQITNRHTEMKSLLNAFVGEVQSLTACEAVGIRILDDEGNIPYEAYTGFTEGFYGSESPLSIKSDECMCINVIKGDIDPKLPFYTEGGSFYMNGSTRFLATVSEEEKGNTRNVCNQSGYESVALIPIRVNERILGLIHIADTREEMVPLWMVETLEAVGLQLGTGIERVAMHQSLQESEKRYRILSENLEIAVRERIKELRQSESLASIGQMVSVVAHDIRNPLQAIKMGVGALRKELSEDKRKSEILEEMDYGVTALESIVGELLEYARPVQLHYSSWPIRNIVSRSLDTLRAQIGRIRVHLELEDEDKEMHLDGAKMVRVLSNLILNAAEAMPDGGDLRISSRFFALDTGQVLRLTISDNGHGIEEEDLPRIYEPFVTTKPQGTGLGIPICKKIIQAHNGNFRINSKVNEGTIVDIELPVRSS